MTTRHPNPSKTPGRSLIRASDFDAMGVRIAGSVRAFDDLIDRTVTRIAYCPRSAERIPGTPYRVVRVPRPGLTDVVVYFTVTRSACVLEFAAVCRKPA